MKKAVAFLLAFLIFVAPMTTLVKADVVIGDNDNIITNENATILGRKLALLESFSDLALSGVTEYTISNTDNVDDYLDYLWDNINDAIDYLDSGEGFQDLSAQLQSKYWYNLVNYKDYISNRGSYLANLLQNPSTTLLSTYFANNVFPKQYTEQCDLALDMFRSLSALNGNNPTPSPEPEYNTFVRNITGLTISGYDFLTIPLAYSNQKWDNRTDYSYYKTSNFNNGFVIGGSSNVQFYASTPITLYINGNDNVGWNMSCSITNVIPWSRNGTNYDRAFFEYAYINSNKLEMGLSSTWYSPDATKSYSSGSLTTMFNWLNLHFRHCNIYVNGEPWGLISPVSYPTLDIDGFMKIYGNDEPQQYQLQPNTQIDYNQLYQVIYNAIRDNLPISQGDINYYDSHDTIYSPTIINNYGDEEGEESDLIDTILDYAVIPKFDTAIAQPMRSALTNGVVIMNTSITDVIPDEILLILGACFFLLLFAVVINRMIK